MKEDNKPNLTIQLKYSKYEVYRVGDGGYISTTLNSSSLTCIGTREDNQTNRSEAEREGYEPSPSGIWRALVEHELLHSLIAEYLFDRESSVIKTEAGGGVEPLWDRYYEEALVLSIQAVLNGLPCPDVLVNLLEDDKANLQRLITHWEANIVGLLEGIR